MGQRADRPAAEGRRDARLRPGDGGDADVGDGAQARDHQDDPERRPHAPVDDVGDRVGRQEVERLAAEERRRDEAVGSLGQEVVEVHRPREGVGEREPRGHEQRHEPGQGDARRHEEAPDRGGRREDGEVPAQEHEDDRAAERQRHRRDERGHRLRVRGRGRGQARRDHVAVHQHPERVGGEHGEQQVDAHGQPHGEATPARQAVRGDQEGEQRRHRQEDGTHPAADARQHDLLQAVVREVARQAAGGDRVARHPVVDEQQRDGGERAVAAAGQERDRGAGSEDGHDRREDHAHLVVGAALPQRSPGRAVQQRADDAADQDREEPVEVARLARVEQEHEHHDDEHHPDAPPPQDAGPRAREGEHARDRRERIRRRDAPHPVGPQLSVHEPQRLDGDAEERADGAREHEPEERAPPAHEVLRDADEHQHGEERDDELHGAVGEEGRRGGGPPVAAIDDRLVPGRQLVVDDAPPRRGDGGQHGEQEDDRGDPEGHGLRDEARQEGAGGALQREDAGARGHRVSPRRWPRVGSASAVHHFTVPQSCELPGAMLRRASMPAATAAASTCSTPGRYPESSSPTQNTAWVSA